MVSEFEEGRRIGRAGGRSLILNERSPRSVRGKKGHPWKKG